LRACCLTTGDHASRWVGRTLTVKENQEGVFITPNHSRYQGLHYDFEVESLQWAVFTNLEWQLNPQAAVELGWRWERVNYDYDNLMVAGSVRDDGSNCTSGDCRYYRPEDRSDQFDNLSGQLGIRYSLNTEWHLYARVAKAYRAPQINERYRLLSGQSVGEFEEKSIDSIEAGIRWKTGKASAELSAYLMKKKDQVIKASNNATVGDAQTRHYGVELQLGYTFNPQWSIDMVASWAEHQVNDSSLLNGQDISGNHMDTAPEWMGSLAVHYQPFQSVWFELQSVYMGDYYLDAENEHFYSGHTLLNAIASWKINPSWNTRLRLHNLTDRRYAERGDFAFGNYRYFVGEDRAFYLEVQRQF
jgi:outer membrane receptor protein involved in Fe transport